MKNIKKFAAGIAIGAVNVILGAGGGMLTVPLYRKLGMDQKQSQINAVATILPITVISACIYLLNENVSFLDAGVYIIPGLLGSVAGTFLIKKASNKILTVIFALFMIWAGARMFLK
ncbi:MAG: sulfite exporter TauE/SafE family protein [Oscillospiraceae bacterium]|nr:sulfite exporter TauE/SafE family protein [Oscillospiraceae bacterium]